jgi:hypothetical protein
MDDAQFIDGFSELLFRHVVEEENPTGEAELNEAREFCRQAAGDVLKFIREAGYDVISTQRIM